MVSQNKKKGHDRTYEQLTHNVVCLVAWLYDVVARVHKEGERPHTQAKYARLCIINIDILLHPASTCQNQPYNHTGVLCNMCLMLYLARPRPSCIFVSRSMSFCFISKCGTACFSWILEWCSCSTLVLVALLQPPVVHHA